MTRKELTVGELEIMEHALGAKSKAPGYRNHYAAGEGCDNYATICNLVEKGLMARGRTHGTILFHVTPAGQELIGCKEQEAE